MRPAEFSTVDPPRPIDCLETRVYISALRRRIEVQNDLMEALAKDVQKLQNEVDKLSLDLGIRQGQVSGWQEVKP